MMKLPLLRRWLAVLNHWLVLAVWLGIGIPARGYPAAPWKISPFLASKARNPTASVDLAASAQRGERLYEQQCASCHGPHGKGDGPAAAPSASNTDLTTVRQTRQSDGELFMKITKGRPPMPAYETVLSEAQRWDLVNFLRTWAPKSKEQLPPSAVSPKP